MSNITQIKNTKLVPMDCVSDIKEMFLTDVRQSQFHAHLDVFIIGIKY